MAATQAQQETGRPVHSASATSYQRLSEIVQLAPIGIGIVDLEGRTILTNHALRDMLGYTADEFAAVHFSEFTHPEDLERNLELFAELSSGASERFEMEKRFFARDGSMVWGRLTVSLIRDEEGAPSLAIGMLENITERRRLEVQLSQAETTYRMLVEQVPAVVYMAPVDGDRPWVYVSPQIASTLGFTPEEWLADPRLWFRQMHPDDRGIAVAMRDPESMGMTQTFTSHYRMRRRDGVEIWVRDECALVDDEDHGEVLRGVLLDVTREKELEARLELQAFHDALTQLPNRILFGDRVEQCLRRAVPGRERTNAVVFVDLDDFKTVNDSLGHAAGDELICSVAERIRTSVRPGDTPGRLGGDEFGILLEDLADARDAIVAAERIQQALQRPHRLTNKTVVTSASIGIAYVQDVDTAEAVLRNADLAMYRAKELGKGRIATFEPVMHELAVRRMDIRSALEGALARRELAVYFQPIVDLETAEVVGAEALLRWLHPTFGFISPEDFIPIAEETRSITQIGEWVLREACTWLAQHGGDAGLSVSVNVSPVQLEDATLVARVSKTLAATGVQASSVVLEITEQGLMCSRSWAVLRDLKSLGVRIAIDDFGTGYASLAYLNELAVDVLKIDRSFVAGLDEAERTHAVPRAVIQLAASLGLGIVAEGIETADQLHSLRGMGCTQGQGYLFSRPVPAVEAALLLGSRLHEEATTV